MVAEKVVVEDEETGLLHTASGLRSNGSLHSVGTHDSSSSLDWTIDAVPSKARHLTVLVTLVPCPFVNLALARDMHGDAHVVLQHAPATLLVLLQVL